MVVVAEPGNSRLRMSRIEICSSIMMFVNCQILRMALDEKSYYSNKVASSVLARMEANGTQSPRR